MAEKEMTAEEFLRERLRMCGLCDSCRLCPLYALSKADNRRSCSTNCGEHPAEAVAIVQKWAEEHPEHPVRTRLSVFRELFPNAEYDLGKGYPLQSCPHFYDAGFNDGCADAIPCEECKARFWGEEIKEDNDAGTV